MQEVPKKLRVEMLEREIHGLDIELAELYRQHVILLRQIDGLVELRVGLVRRIEAEQ